MNWVIISIKMLNSKTALNSTTNTSTSIRSIILYGIISELPTTEWVNLKKRLKPMIMLW